MSKYNNQDTANWDAKQVRRGISSLFLSERRKPRYPTTIVAAGDFSADGNMCCLSLLASVLVAGVGWLLINDFCAFSKADVTTTIQVTASDNLKSVADKLHDAGLIQYKWFFRFFGVLQMPTTRSVSEAMS